jgi:hypothetical protein
MVLKLRDKERHTTPSQYPSRLVAQRLSANAAHWISALCLKYRAIAKLPGGRAGASLELNRVEGHYPTSTAPATQVSRLEDSRSTSKTMQGAREEMGQPWDNE